MLKLIIGIVSGVFLAIFISQNLMIVDVVFLAWTITMSRALLLIIILLIGIVLGWVFTSLSNIKRKKSHNKVTK